MKSEPDGDPGLWLREKDGLGQEHDKVILDTAKRNWKRVLAYAERQGQDPSVAADIVERIMGALTSLKVCRPEAYARIRDFDAYLFWAAAWRINRLVTRQPMLEYVGSLNDLHLLADTRDSDAVLRIEREILIKEVMGFMSERARLLISRRQAGYSWRDIAKSLGSTPLCVRVQLSEGLATARRRILRKTVARPENASELGRPK